MKVTVNKFLYVRVGAPSLNAPRYQYLAPGSELEVEDKLYDGDEFEGSKKWLKDGANNYYWAGGVILPDSTIGETIAIPDSSYEHWYLKNFGIKNIHDKGFRGDNVSVCIIDSGIVKQHPAFDYTTIITRSFIGGVITDNGVDDFGHGTQCAGIVRSRGQKVAGVALNAKLVVEQCYSFKVKNKEDLVFALENVSPNTDVLSISVTIPQAFPDNLKTRIAAATDKLIANGTIVVVAHGNVASAYNMMGQLSGVISVGAIDKNDAYNAYTTDQGRCTIFAPGAQIITTGLNAAYNTVSGTSYATPFVAGVCALAKQVKKTLTSPELKNLLLTTSDNLLTNPGFKKINPGKLINALTIHSV